MKKIISLAALEEPCPSLSLADGREVAIRQIDGVGMQLMQEAENNPVIFWEVAARCLPDVPHAEVHAFTINQVRKVVEIACGAAERVIAALGEGSAPAEATPLAPTSSTPIPSGS
jgi:hypothetical protein